MHVFLHDKSPSKKSPAVIVIELVDRNSEDYNSRLPPWLQQNPRNFAKNPQSSPPDPTASNDSGDSDNEPKDLSPKRDYSPRDYRDEPSPPRQQQGDELRVREDQDESRTSPVSRPGSSTSHGKPTLSKFF